MFYQYLDTVPPQLTIIRCSIFYLLQSNFTCIYNYYIYKLRLMSQVSYSWNFMQRVWCWPHRHFTHSHVYFCIIKIVWPYTYHFIYGNPVWYTLLLFLMWDKACNIYSPSVSLVSIYFTVSIDFEVYWRLVVEKLQFFCFIVIRIRLKNIPFSFSKQLGWQPSCFVSKRYHPLWVWYILDSSLIYGLTLLL